MMHKRLLSAAIAIAALSGLALLHHPPLAQNATAVSTPQQDWPVYGGQAAGTHYSSLQQIDRGNVAKLKVAWTYDTKEKGGLQTSPIIVGRTLYAYTPTQKVIALDAATGALKWTFDSGINGTQPARGLAYWTDGKETRILAGVMHFLYALDAETGKPIPSFGEGGRVDLREGLRRNPKDVSIALTSPGIVYKDLIIVGGRDPETLPAPPGDIRAYDVRTGKVRWSFHTIPHPGEFGYDTWPKNAWLHSGAANNWAGMALDAERGIVYVPTGSAAFDFYGGDRVGKDLFADCLLALNAETGERLWHFQGVHHDIWDRDFPSPPALLTVQHDGKQVDAVAQTSKQGWVYLFDRVTGASLFPIDEKAYPPSTVPGEKTWPVQSLPTEPTPYARQTLTAEMLTERTPEAHAWALKEFRSFRSGGQFVPPSLMQQTVVFPGYDGGAEWGGPAVDPETGLLYVNANEMAWTGGLAKNAPVAASGTGRGGSAAQAAMGAQVYQSQCSICHQQNRAGAPPTFPSLLDLKGRLTRAQVEQTVLNGKGRMPGFPQLAGEKVTVLVAYLMGGPGKAAAHTADRQEAKNQRAGEQHGMPQHTTAQTIPVRTKEMASRGADRDTGESPYRFTGYRRFLDPEGYPAIRPPWGTLSAIDLNTGAYAWKIPLGEYPELAAKGLADTGSENYGGPIVTAGGLVFIGATVYDKQIRAFDKGTGKLLWQATLPFAATATPATYEVDGRQYVVIAAGGGKDPKSPSGGVYVAFALPKE